MPAILWTHYLLNQPSIMSATAVDMDLAQALLVEARFNLFFRRQITIRQRALLFEQRLKEKYSPVTVLPVADEMPPEIFRLSLQSKNRFSSLLVAQTTALHTTSFSDEWKSRHSDCMAYVRERVGMIFPLIAEVIDDKVRYVGLTLRFQFLSGFAGKDDATSFLTSKIFRQDMTPKSIEEVSARIAFRYGNQFFANLNFQNVVNFTVPPENPNQGIYSLNELKTESCGIEIALDINDRQAFNKNPAYATRAETLEELFSIANAIQTEKLNNFFKSGDLGL